MLGAVCLVSGHPAPAKPGRFNIEDGSFNFISDILLSR